MAKKVKLSKWPEARIRLTGEAESGKTTFYIAMAKYLGGDTYIWNTDGRIQEARRALGDTVYKPTASPLDVLAISAEVDADIKAGLFKTVNLFALDNLTQIFEKVTGISQVKSMQKESNIGPAEKAAKMKVVRTILASLPDHVHYVVLLHAYEAAAGTSTEQLKNPVERDTISDTEDDRLRRLFNLHLKTLFDEKTGKYGVMVEEYRYRPGMKPLLVFWDEAGMFEGMYERIMTKLCDEPVPAEEPKTWADFSEKHPFPNADIAIEMGTNFFVEISGGLRFYPFGDPNAEVTKKNGDPGTNGVLIHARGAYEKLKRGEYEGFKKPATAGDMAVAWKMLCERKAWEEVQKLGKKQPAEPTPMEELAEAPPEAELQEEMF